MDIEKMAREAGAHELSFGIWQFEPAQLQAFARLVLEEAAKQFDVQPHVEMFRPSVADEIRALADSIGAGR